MSAPRAEVVEAQELAASFVTARDDFESRVDGIADRIYDLATRAVDDGDDALAVELIGLNPCVVSRSLASDYRRQAAKYKRVAADS